jgi:F0F1-type ATP synthase assembly protein I
MKQTKAPKQTPSPSSKGQTRAVADKASSTVFVSMVFDMSWRLAIVVLVPIIVGVELDHYFKAGYSYVIVGLVVALILAVLVVYRSYLEANKVSVKPNKGRKR